MPSAVNDGTLVRMLRRFVRHAGRAYARSGWVPQRGKGRLTAALGRLDHNGREPVETEFRPGLWASLDLGSHVERQMYYEGFYRPWVLPHFEDLLTEGSIVADVGANVGAFSLVAARRVGPAGRVLALEPDPAPFEKLVRNIKMNHLENVIPLRLAVGPGDGAALLHRNPAGHPNEAQASLAAMEMHERAEQVTLRSLDSLLEENHLPRLDVLKVDAQGGELGVLRGAARSIAAGHPGILLRCHEEKCRASGNGTVELQRWLLEAGYRLRLLERGTPPPRRGPLPADWFDQPGQVRPLEDASLLAVHRSRATAAASA